MQDSYHPDLGRHPNRHMTLAKPEKAFAYVGCEAPRFGTVNPVVGLNCQQLAWGVTRRKKPFLLMWTTASALRIVEDMDQSILMFEVGI